MCEQCQVFSLNWKLSPSWALMYARRNGDIMKRGEWGLVTMNNPSVVWKVPPEREPDNDHYGFLDRLTQFEEELRLTPRDGHSLYTELSLVRTIHDLGLDQCSFAWWLFAYMRHIIDTIDPADDGFCIETLGRLDIKEIIRILKAGQICDRRMSEKVALVKSHNIPSYTSSPYRKGNYDQ